MALLSRFREIQAAGQLSAPAPDSDQQYAALQRGDADSAPDVGYVDEIVHKEKRRDFEGMLRATRKRQFEELFWEKYPDWFIKECQARYPVPPECLVWIKDVLPIRGHSASKWTVAFDPAFNRWGIFEKVNSTEGSGYYRLFIAHEDPVPGKLPSDLDQPRFRHQRGRLGEFRPLTKQDFEKLRYYGDRGLSREESDRRLDEEETCRQADIDCKREAIQHDFLDYYFLSVNTAANGGAKQYSVDDQSQNVKPKRVGGAHRTRVIDRDGFKIRCKDGFPISRKLDADLQDERAYIDGAGSLVDEILDRKEQVIVKEEVQHGSR